jgi:hypothetical protein
LKLTLRGVGSGLGGWAGAVLKLKVSVGGELKLKACPCVALKGGGLKLKGW